MASQPDRSKLCILIVLLALCFIALQPAARAGELLFGHISSATNPASAYNAKELQAGIQLAFDEANATGGVSGNTFILEIRDDSLDAAKMVAANSELMDNKQILGLVGYLNTAGLTELSKADAYLKNGIALIAPYQGNASVVGAANVFPFRSGYNDEIVGLLKTLQRGYKSRLAVVYFNVAFGPPIAKFASEQLGAMKIEQTDMLELDGKPNGNLQDSIDKAIAAVKKSKPDAVLVVAAGKAAMGFVKALRATDLINTQIYGMSTLVPKDILDTVGPAAARGIVLSQAVPYPYSPTLKLVDEYLHAVKKYSPKRDPSFSHVEGYIAGRITILATQRAGRSPSRGTILKALYSMGQLDLGGPVIQYDKNRRTGWGKTEMVIFGENGQILR